MRYFTTSTSLFTEEGRRLGRLRAQRANVVARNVVAFHREPRVSMKTENSRAITTGHRRTMVPSIVRDGIPQQISINGWLPLILVDFGTTRSRQSTKAVQLRTETNGFQTRAHPLFEDDLTSTHTFENITRRIPSMRTRARARALILNLTRGIVF